jgi:NAD(P)H-quinone oxidoreductase subunit 5
VGARLPVRFILGLARYAALGTLGLALASLVIVSARGPFATETLGQAGIGVALYLDRLSALMFCLVAFIGVIVVNYSRNYLDGDPGQSRFIRWLCLTLGAVLFIIIAGNLALFTLAWIATSLGLHRLLVFYPERPAAILAARKKFIASRLGELCLIGAAILLYQSFGSLDYGRLFAGAQAQAAAGTPVGPHGAALLIIVTGLLKSAQFPLHGWLIEVMETPTPVSALLHAGIINAGGFLVVRFAHLIMLSTPALDVLAVVAGWTALFGSVVMLTQTSIKVSLAYSTIAQMGFMMLECGLGVFSAAVLHILTHSLYKAHAFLSSGSVIDIARASWTPSPGGKPHPARLAIAIAAVLGTALAVGSLFGATPSAKPGVLALGAVLLLGVIHLVANGLDERPNSFVVIRTVGLAIVVAVIYFGMQYAAERYLIGVLPASPALQGPLELAIIVGIVASFAAVTVLQTLLPRNSDEPRWEALYMPISHGLYVNTLANRLVLRVWPTRARSS